MTFRRNPNRAALRERYRALQAEQAGPHTGDVVRVVRDNAAVEVVRVLDTFTNAASGIAMLTVRNAPFGIQSFTVRADAVLPDDAPDDRHDGVECQGLCPQHKVEFTAARDNEWEAGL
jgi:hypothetical protein